MLPAVRAAWQYRSFIRSNVLREFRGRYQESLLGAAWAVVSPLAMIVIYTVVFGQLLGARLAGSEQLPFAFSIYLCAGVIPWTLFSEMLTRLTSTFIDNAAIIKKTRVPRVCFPIQVALSSLINFGILLMLYFTFLLLAGHTPTLTMLALLPLLAIQLGFTLGLGLILSTANVFFRDVGQFVGVVLQFWFWLTPIVYLLDVVPANYREWLLLNPMTPLVAGYQAVFLHRVWPDFLALLPLALVSLLLIFLGGRFFLRHAGELVDAL